MHNAFEYKDVVRTFPGFKLGPLNLTLEPGKALGFIGPNGSGKTTTIQCLTGLLKSDSGEINIFGRQNNMYKPEWKWDIGYVGDVHSFFDHWTGEKNLEFRAQFYPQWSHQKAKNMAKRFQLPLGKKAKHLSSGNRVKLSLVMALAHSPKLLLLDEPTSGLDPVIRKEVIDILFETLESGENAIFYATHILPELERLVDELAFIDEGLIWKLSSKEDLIESWRRISFKSKRIPEKLKEIVNLKSENNHHQIITFDFNRTIKYLQEMRVENITEMRMSIDEIAVELIKKGKEQCGN